MLIDSPDPARSLALALLRMMADAGVSRDVDTWDLIGMAGFKAIFGEAAFVAFESRREFVWPVMKELAPQLEEWP